MTKLAKFSLGAALLGLLVLGCMFVYYHFHLGIKPCEGLPTDASNCGDADLGGVYFIFVGFPLIFLGIVGLLADYIRRYLKRNTKGGAQ